MLLFAFLFLHAKLCSVRIYLQLFVAGRPSSLRSLCLFPLSDVQRILCCVFVALVLCTICCQFLLIVPLFLIISSLRFIEKDCETSNPNNLNKWSNSCKAAYTWGCWTLSSIIITMTSRDVWTQVFDNQLYISILHFPCHNLLWQCTKFIGQS